MHTPWENDAHEDLATLMTTSMSSVPSKPLRESKGLEVVRTRTSSMGWWWTSSILCVLLHPLLSNPWGGLCKRQALKEEEEPRCNSSEEEELGRAIETWLSLTMSAKEGLSHAFYVVWKWSNRIWGAGGAWGSTCMDDSTSIYGSVDS